MFKYKIDVMKSLSRKNKVFLNTKFSVYLYMKMCYTVTIIKKGDITVWQI